MHVLIVYEKQGFVLKFYGFVFVGKKLFTLNYALFDGMKMERVRTVYI